MTIKEITKQQLFDLLGETPTDTNRIDNLLIHQPHDPNKANYVFNYRVVKIKPDTTSAEVVP